MDNHLVLGISYQVKEHISSGVIVIAAARDLDREESLSSPHYDDADDQDYPTQHLKNDGNTGPVHPLIPFLVDINIISTDSVVNNSHADESACQGRAARCARTLPST